MTELDRWERDQGQEEAQDFAQAMMLPGMQILGGREDFSVAADTLVEVPQQDLEEALDGKTGTMRPGSHFG